jgi:hypothetical protein
MPRQRDYLFSLLQRADLLILFQGVFICLKGEQNQPKTVNFQEYPIERRLIGQESVEHSSPGCLMMNLKVLKPFLPGQVEMPFESNVASHWECALLSFRMVEGYSSIG